MKFALFDFFEEGTVEIGSTDMICLDENDTTVSPGNFNNEKWESTTEVLVKWPSKKGPKSSTQLCVANVVYFADERRDQGMLAKRDKLTASPAPSTSTAEDSNKRTQKRPQRYASDEDDSSAELCASNISSKPKIKKVKIAKRDDMLVDRLVKKKEAAKKIEQQPQPQELDRVIEENRSLKAQLAKVTKEKDAVVSTLACIRELPHLLQQMKSLQTQPASTIGFSCSTPIRQSTHSFSSDENNTRPLTPKHAANGSTIYTAPKYLQDMMTKSFGREEMASHSLTGSSSNANAAVEVKPQLNKQKMDEIFEKVKSRFPTIELKYIKEVARNKLSNERKLHKRALSKRE